MEWLDRSVRHSKPMNDALNGLRLQEQLNDKEITFEIFWAHLYWRACAEDEQSVLARRSDAVPTSIR